MDAILLFMGIGMEEMLVIGLFVLVFFGADKVPDFMKGLGKGVREFKNGLNKIHSDDDDEDDARPEVKPEAQKNPQALSTKENEALPSKEKKVPVDDMRMEDNQD